MGFQDQVHVFPLNDIGPHKIDDLEEWNDCDCQPKWVWGGARWCVIHKAWDGREKRECIQELYSRLWPHYPH